MNKFVFFQFAFAAEMSSVYMQLERVIVNCLEEHGYLIETVDDPHEPDLCLNCSKGGASFNIVAVVYEDDPVTGSLSLEKLDNEIIPETILNILEGCLIKLHGISSCDVVTADQLGDKMGWS